MIAQLNGLVAEKNADSIVLDVNGVGFLVLTSANTLAAAPAAGEKLKLYTVFIVREDAMELFGFATRDERHMFDKLRGVTGVGPRTALAMLSALSVREITLALLTGDSGALTKAPGIGKKTAQRLVLELKDKVDQSELAMPDLPAASPAKQTGAVQEATEALIALGYQPAEAAIAIAAVQDQSEQVDELIRLALRGMMK
ncbi:MAG: Holliday junction branch migration protein RuvA [Clostridia bacterium]|nr:Holliday junction branch migration protein RuvA [Clostridia bacterium]